MALKTDYKDYVLSASMMGKQRFKNVQNSDGSYSVTDVSEYDQEGDVITASMLNGMNAVANELSENISAAESAATRASASATDANTYMGRAETAANNAASSASQAASSISQIGTSVADCQAAASVATQGASEAEEYRDQAKAYSDNAQAVTGIDIATTELAGIVKPDGETITVDIDGTIHGASQVPDGVAYVKNQAAETQTLADLPLLSKVKTGLKYHDQDVFAYIIGQGIDGTNVTTLWTPIFTFKSWSASSTTTHWDTSNIRQWANSDAEAGQWYSAQFSGDLPPSAENVLNGYDAYDTEQGFLRYFPEEIRNLLVPRTSVTYRRNNTSAQYIETSDKVFILSSTANSSYYDTAQFTPESPTQMSSGGISGLKYPILGYFTTYENIIEVLDSSNDYNNNAILQMALDYCEGVLPSSSGSVGAISRDVIFPFGTSSTAYVNGYVGSKNTSNAGINQRASVTGQYGTTSGIRFAFCLPDNVDCSMDVDEDGCYAVIVEEEGDQLYAKDSEGIERKIYPNIAGMSYKYQEDVASVSGSASSGDWVYGSNISLPAGTHIIHVEYASGETMGDESGWITMGVAYSNGVEIFNEHHYQYAGYVLFSSSTILTFDEPVIIKGGILHEIWSGGAFTGTLKTKVVSLIK